MREWRNHLILIICCWSDQQVNTWYQRSLLYKHLIIIWKTTMWNYNVKLQCKFLELYFISIKSWIFDVDWNFNLFLIIFFETWTFRRIEWVRQFCWRQMHILGLVESCFWLEFTPDYFDGAYKYQWSKPIHETWSSFSLWYAVFVATINGLV